MPLIIHSERQPDRLIVIGGPKIQPPPIENKQGRKKMADEKKLGHETGVKKISQEPANKQGPIGTGGKKEPPSPPAEDLTIGDKEKKPNG